MVKKHLIALCLLISAAAMLFPEESHQRIGTEKEASRRFTMNGAVSFSANALSGYDIYTILPEISAQYMLSDTWYLDIALPCKSTLNMGKDDPDPLLFAFGDPAISAGYTTRIENYKLRLALSYSYALGIWGPNQAEETGIISSSGYHQAAVTASLSRILDPVIMNTTLIYSVGLPREEESGWSMTPGDISLTFSLTEVLNDEIGISFSAVNNLHLPVINSGKMRFEETSYNLFLSISLLWHRKSVNANLTINKNVSAFTSSPTVKAG